MHSVPLPDHAARTFPSPCWLRSSQPASVSVRHLWTEIQTTRRPAAARAGSQWRDQHSVQRPQMQRVWEDVPQQGSVFTFTSFALSYNQKQFGWCTCTWQIWVSFLEVEIKCPILFQRKSHSTQYTHAVTLLKHELVNIPPSLVTQFLPDTLPITGQTVPPWYM